jgi:hypothetical protein
MDRFHIALFLHIVALVVASSAAAVTKLAAGRRARARTFREAIEWHNVLSSTAKLFPVCLTVFVITGSYMLSFGSAEVWTSGYVVAGLVGVALLLASGIFLAIKGKALAAVLEKMAAASGADSAVPQLAPPMLVVALPVINTGVALAVVFDMVTKPASVVVALSVVALGIAIPATMILRPRQLSTSAARGR